MICCCIAQGHKLRMMKIYADKENLNTIKKNADIKVERANAL